jgi:hypothetical protein
MKWRILYFFVFSVYLLVVGFILGSWSFRHVVSGGERIPTQLAWIVEKLASSPAALKLAWQTVSIQTEDPYPEFLIPKQKWDDGNRFNSFPAASDSGFLLLSGFDDVSRSSAIRLIRISDGKEITRWEPDWVRINSESIDHRFAPKGSAKAMRAFHPLMLSDGSIVFNTGSVLVKQELCSATHKWLLNGVFHHSNELGHDGTLWTPSISEKEVPGFEHPLLAKVMRDDSLANISVQGKLIQNISFSKVLKDNGLDVLLLGFSGVKINQDPIHINQITPAQNDGVMWKKGDLLISARHLSAVFIYRPATNKIVWHKIGPWKNQHSASFVDNKHISVFDNNVFGGPPEMVPFTNRNEVNKFYIVDVEKDVVSEPFSDVLSKLKPRTVTEGRAELIAEDRLFIEETNFGRHLVVTQSNLIWSRLNAVGGRGDLGITSWSRYVNASEGAKISALAGAKVECKEGRHTHLQ